MSWKNSEIYRSRGIIMAIVIMILIISCAPAAASPKTSCELNGFERSIVSLSYSIGEPYDLGETMVAIALEESELGRYRISLSDPSAGVYHTLISHAIKDLGWKDNSYNRNRAAQLLIDDHVYAAHLAIGVLKWWHNYRGGDWKETLSGYNGGHKGNPSYVRRIANHIKHIRQCKWVESFS